VLIDRDDDVLLCEDVGLVGPFLNVFVTLLLLTSFLKSLVKEGGENTDLLGESLVSCSDLVVKVLEAEFDDGVVDCGQKKMRGSFR